jgi:hypothetical protein
MTTYQKIQSVTDSVKARIAKPDHPFWRKLANWFVVVGGPAGEIAVQLFVPEPYKKIASIGWAVIVGTAKLGSKLTVAKTSP